MANCYEIKIGFSEEFMFPVLQFLMYYCALISEVNVYWTECVTDKFNIATITYDNLCDGFWNLSMNVLLPGNC